MFWIAVVGEDSPTVGYCGSGPSFTSALMSSEGGFANILLATSIGIQETACFAPGEDDHP